MAWGFDDGPSFDAFLRRNGIDPTRLSAPVDALPPSIYGGIFGALPAPPALTSSPFAGALTPAPPPPANAYSLTQPTGFEGPRRRELPPRSDGTMDGSVPLDAPGGPMPTSDTAHVRPALLQRLQVGASKGGIAGALAGVLFDPTAEAPMMQIQTPQGPVQQRLHTPYEGAVGFLHNVGNAVSVGAGGNPVDLSKLQTRRAQLAADQAEAQDEQERAARLRGIGEALYRHLQTLDPNSLEGFHATATALMEAAALSGDPRYLDALRALAQQYPARLSQLRVVLGADGIPRFVPVQSAPSYR